jgi:predicted ribosomally synthesized peptide with nif11-like leader
MTENLKAFLEAASKDRTLAGRLKEADTPEAVLALAAEQGFALSAADLEISAAPAAGEISDDELDAVAGGGNFDGCCLCISGGYGDDGDGDGPNEACYCFVAGAGLRTGASYDSGRCVCAWSGGGYDDRILI